MKKVISLLLALTLLLGILAIPAMAVSMRVGSLSYLNLTEEQGKALSAFRQSLLKLLVLHGVIEGEEPSDEVPAFRMYDTLNAMLMALQSGEVNAIKVPYYTGRYLCSTNNELRSTSVFHPEKASKADETAINMLSDGYSFMLKEENTALRDAFDAQITAMKEDGTLQQLIDEHIIKVAESGEPVAIAFEQFEGDPIKVAVTGSLPPMDYVAADGSFAGFNTAVLAEIGRRLQKNMELVQVDSIGRALALSEGTVDVVFWTRGTSENELKSRQSRPKPGDGKMEEKMDEQRVPLPDEENAYSEIKNRPSFEEIEKADTRDIPDGTIITQPYFSDIQTWIVLNDGNLSGTGTGDAVNGGNRPTRLEDLLNQTVPENAIYVQDNLGSGR